MKSLYKILNTRESKFCTKPSLFYVNVIDKILKYRIQIKNYIWVCVYIYIKEKPTKKNFLFSSQIYKPKFTKVFFIIQCKTQYNRFFFFFELLSPMDILVYCFPLKAYKLIQYTFRDIWKNVTSKVGLEKREPVSHMTT